MQTIRGLVSSPTSVVRARKVAVRQSPPTPYGEDSVIRLIARIDARNGQHIKTIRCEGTKVLRDVTESISLFSSGPQAFDEIMLLDNVATLYGYENWLLREQEAFLFCPLPLSIGGAINSQDLAKRTLQSGADKIIVNSGAIADPNLIERLAKVCGRQAVVLQIDAKLVDNCYRCCTHGSRELSNQCAKSWIASAQQMGAGEIHLTSVDSEGIDSPFPIDLAEIARSSTSLPIIVSGGINTAIQIQQLRKTYCINSFSLSSIPNRLDIPIDKLSQELSDLGETVHWP